MYGFPYICLDSEDNLFISTAKWNIFLIVNKEKFFFHIFKTQVFLTQYNITP